ncbi:hypothetical protein [Streptomyces marincola]|uniref:hypothetical protein n=1 Tax=Streptomyces marincola TaxID=2878388 RepID=UPI001CF2D7F6|nr:hypothetical protein [Streptomyces marincola]UCM92017.1 hypothetical protein LC193_15215 [Streptomyces marincola]
MADNNNASEQAGQSETGTGGGAVYIGANGDVAVVGEGTVIIGDVYGGISMDFTTKKN